MKKPKMTQIQPIGTKILIKKEEKIKKSEGGLFLVDETVDRQFQCEGTVIAIGPLVSKGIAVGDEIIFGQFAGSAYKEFHFIAEADVLGKAE